MTLSRRQVVFSVAALPIAFRATTTAAQSTPVASPSASPVVMPDLDAALQSLIDENGAAGLSMHVVTADGAPIDSNVGMADLATGEAVTAKHHFRIGSITKSFTATRFLMLVDEGKVGLEDTIATVLPDYADLPNADTITMRQLLNMRAGLNEYTASPQFMDAWTKDPTTPYEISDIIHWVKDMPVLFQPGEAFTYINTNYALIGEVIAKLTGKTVDQAIMDDIVTPLGLTDTTYPTETTIPAPFAHGYVYPEGVLAQQQMAEEAAIAMGTPVATPIASPAATAAAAMSTDPVDVTELHPSIPGAAGAMISTTTDLATWLQACLNGDLLSPEMLKEQTTFIDTEQGMSYGMGLFSVQGMVGHNGLIDGFASLMIQEPQSGTNVTVLVNSNPCRSGQDLTFLALQTLLTV